jgi:hypothetical protein
MRTKSLEGEMKAPTAGLDTNFAIARSAAALNSEPTLSPFP